MNNLELRERAKEILSRGEVQCLIGYGSPSPGFRVSPLFVRTAEDADRLTFSPLCNISLVNYLTLEKGALLEGNRGAGKKVAVLVRGCDSRALTQLIVEKGIAREKVVVLGLPCRGVVDLKKLETKFPACCTCEEFNEQGDSYVFRIDGGRFEVPRTELLAAHCTGCRFPNPVLYDVLLEEPVTPWEASYADVAAVEAMPPEQREAFWKEAFSRCLRCYACRNACPLCYCDDCVLERLGAQFVHRSVTAPDNLVYHLARAYHLAGRCAGCGECERVCPVNLPLMLLNRKMEKDVKELFDYTAGTEAEQKPVFSTFDTKDPGDFIL